MQDRVPVNPGRVLITPENGSAAYYATMTRADNPTQEGTPLNKASLLKDATAALFGLGADVVPDDVFSFLGKYNQHWWRRTGYVAAHLVKTPFTNQFFRMTGSAGSSTRIKYSATCSISPDGTISLENPTTVSRKYSDAATIQSEIRGKYFTVSLNNDQYITITDICYCDPTATVTSTVDNYYSDPYGITVSSGSAVTGQAENWGGTEMLVSSDRNAYPDSGEVDGYLYEYLGIPFNNAITAPKITTGSYTGTGTYGASNPNSLTFDFEPKAVFISAEGILPMVYIWGNTYMSLAPGGSKANQTAVVETNGTTMSFYSTTSAEYQLNTSGAIYSYFAIG